MSNDCTFNGFNVFLCEGESTGGFESLGQVQ